MNKNGSILIVDDDENILKTISLILKKSGYEVDTAKSGAEALEKCNDQFYTLLLLDLVLTDTDGMKLINRIEDTDPRMRKVIITGHPTLENAIEAVNKGADAYLVKPLNPEELLKTINQQLEDYHKEILDRYPLLSKPDK